MRACGVVADHASDGGSVGGCDIGAEEELIVGEFAYCLVEVIEDDSGLGRAGLAVCVYIDKVIVIDGGVKNDGAVDALSCETGSGPAGEDGEIVFACKVDRGEDVLLIFGDDDGEGFDLVGAGIGGVEHAIVVVGTDFACDFGHEGLDIGG